MENKSNFHSQYIFTISSQSTHYIFGYFGREPFLLGNLASYPLSLPQCQEDDVMAISILLFLSVEAGYYKIYDTVHFTLAYNIYYYYNLCISRQIFAHLLKAKMSVKAKADFRNSILCFSAKLLNRVKVRTFPVSCTEIIWRRQKTIQVVLPAAAAAHSCVPSAWKERQRLP